MSKPISFNLAELERILGAKLEGNPSCAVDNIATISNSNNSSITFFANQKYKDHLVTSKAAAFIVSSEFETKNLDGNYLKCEDPYLAFAKLTHLFKTSDYDLPFIHPSAVISENSDINIFHVGQRSYSRINNVELEEKFLGSRIAKKK